MSLGPGKARAPGGETPKHVPAPARVAPHPRGSTEHAGPSGLAAVPQAAGNLAIQQRMLGGGLPRAKLAISQPSDPEERQADHIAERVTRGPALTDASAPSIQSVARSSAATASADGLLGNLGAGQPLDRETRSYFEPRLGADFSQVRVHTGEQAEAAANAIQARAFTAGQSIVLGRGQQPTRSALMAHELAHVTQDPQGTCIRRLLFKATATDADNDQYLLGVLQSQPSYILIDEAREVGGLLGWQKRMPQSFALMRSRAVTEYGMQTIAFLEANDATVFDLVSKAYTVVEKLLELRAHFESQTPEDVAARAVLDYYIGDQNLWGDSVQGLYEISYSYFALHLSKDSRFNLRLHQAMLSGSVEDLVADVADSAGAAAEEASALRQQREAWTAPAAALLGKKVAHRSGIIWDTDYLLAEQLEPTWGSENWDDITAIARLVGHASAVMRIGRRYYAFTLDEDFSRTDVFAAKDWDQASLVLDDVVPGARTVEVVTSDGFVLGLRSGAEAMFGGSQAKNPLQHLEADTRLAQASDDERHGIGPEQIFKSMLRNLALLNLQQSEKRLRGIVASMTPGGMGFGGVDPQRGEALQRATARLRTLTLQSNSLGEEIGDQTPSKEQTARRDDLVSEMGQLVDENPAAAFFVAKHQASTFNSVFSPMGAAIENAIGGVDDELAGMKGGDAATRAIEVANERLENIATVRRALFDEPDIVLGFEMLFDQVYAYFNDSDRLSIRISLVFHRIDEIAHSLRMAGIDLALLIGGFLTEGGTWLALGVEAAGVAYGMVQLQDQYAHTQLTMAMAALDVPGGFELASEEAAASAQHWLWIGIGLNFLGVLGLARTAGRLMRQSAEEAALMGNLARRAGVSEEAIAGAFRRSWRGLPTPDKSALREILLARLTPELRVRYAKVEVVIVDEATWARLYPQNPAGHAAAKFRVPRGGGVEVESIAFRASGNPMAMQEEAEHILQAVSREHGGLVQDLVVAAQDWSRLSPEQRLEAWGTVLELEANAQERLLARAQAEHDVVAMDDAFAEMQDINRRQAEIDLAIGDPSRPPPDWYDATHPPESLFNTPRLPRSKGRWSNPNKPGNCTWISTRPEVLSVVPSGRVEFVNGYPDFRPWAVGETRITQAGTSADYGVADLAFSKQVIKDPSKMPKGYTKADFMHNGEPTAIGTQRYREAAKLTWHHHQGGTVMLLVPTKLNGNIPHTGGAAAARAASP